MGRELRRNLLSCGTQRMLIRSRNKQLDQMSTTFLENCHSETVPMPTIIYICTLSIFTRLLELNVLITYHLFGVISFSRAFKSSSTGTNRMLHNRAFQLSHQQLYLTRVSTLLPFPDCALPFLIKDKTCISEIVGYITISTYEQIFFSQ